MMRSRFLPCLILAVAPVLAMPPSDARADILGGHSLSLTDLCAKRVTIDVDPALRDQVKVTLAADRDEEVRDVRMSAAGQGQGGGQGPVTLVGHFCARHEQVEPSLLVTLLVPPGMPLQIAESTASKYRIGDIGGPLSLSLSGAASIATGRITALDVRAQGTSALTVARLDGDLTYAAAGSSQLAVNEGRIGQAHVAIKGSGSASIGARVAQAWLSVSGVGSIAFDQPVQVVHQREIEGIGSILIP